jgi:hypothetical protein
MTMTTTPPNINLHVLSLCTRLKSTEAPRYVDVQPRSDSGYSDCFNDVARHVEEHGGRRLCGWQIWEWPGVFVEAEFHAVWQRPDSTLTDVQRKPDGEVRILFLPQPTLEFNGIRRDNVRHAIGKDPLIHTFIQMQNRFFKLFQQKCGNQIGEVRLDSELSQLMLEQQNRRLELVSRYGGNHQTGNRTANYWADETKKPKSK